MFTYKNQCIVESRNSPVKGSHIHNEMNLHCDSDVDLHLMAKIFL